MQVRPDRPILVVDDNEAHRLIMRYVLGASCLSNEVLCFASGPEVLEHMAQVLDGSAQAPALVLLDVNMPGTTGFEVLEKIRSIDVFQRLPIIAILTSSDSELDRREAERLEADFLLAKQSGIADFVDLIEASFRNERAVEG
jgi:CheY-like chemotaxis protein